MTQRWHADLISTPARSNLVKTLGQLWPLRKKDLAVLPGKTELSFLFLKQATRPDYFHRFFLPFFEKRAEPKVSK